MCSICKKNDRIVTDASSGEIICSSCGAVISDKVQDISRPEMLSFNIEEENLTRRTGIPTSIAFADMGLSTIIDKHDRDASGRPLDAEMRIRMQRLRMWDLRSHGHSPADRSLMKAFNELNILKDKLALSNAIVEKAAYIYRKVQDRGLIRGRTISGIMAAAVYAACREIGIPYTLRDIAAVGNIRRKDIARNYRKMGSELDLKFPNVDPMKCISRVANKGNLTENTKRQAISIMKEVSERQISAGKDPMGLAASVLYVSCLKTGEDKTQAQIAEASGVTEVTLRTGYKELKNKLLNQTVIW
ncbi:MAG TPA: TFIIB-type zinc ribbon-containing protein [Nitrososphaeraceae archaeon]|nr:TFIIB-type zinc ribbon-containing protein [Nitrososphaeraceae archaeon]